MENLDKKNIGIDARLWGETGVGRYIRNLVIELQKIDKVNEYKLFVLSKDVQNIQETLRQARLAESKRARMTEFGNWSIIPADIPWHSITEQREFPKILEKENLDLVHFPYFSVPIGYKGKYVLTIHDLILHHFPTGKASTKSAPIYWLKHFAYKYIISQAAKKAANIITVSNATKEEVIEHLHIPSGKIMVTYEGVDEKISNLKSQISNKNANYELLTTNYFLYVGNAYPHKNLERLIEAFSFVLRGPVASHPAPTASKNDFSAGARAGAPSRTTPSDVKLILVGKEDYFYKRLEEKVQQMGLTNVILFKHTVTDAELAHLYQHALALVMPSLMEGFGLPLLEAMSMGCLVAASDIPVFKELCGEIPLYFHPKDVQNIANVLESISKGEVTNEKERKEKGKLHTKNFSWSKMAEETLAVYQSSLGVR